MEIEQFNENKMLEIGERIRVCRTSKKMKQSEVAEFLDTSVNTISAIENGTQ